jgi:hypothetical protein
LKTWRLGYPASTLRIRHREAGTFLALLFFMAIAQLAMAVVDVFVWHVRTVLESRRQSFSYSAMPLASRFLKIADQRAWCGNGVTHLEQPASIRTRGTS